MSDVLRAIEKISADMLDRNTIGVIYWCYDHDRGLVNKNPYPWTPQDRLITQRPFNGNGNAFQMALAPLKSQWARAERILSRPSINMQRVSEWAGCLQTCAQQQISSGSKSLPGESKYLDLVGHDGTDRSVYNVDLLQACSKQGNCQHTSLASTSKVNLPQLLTNIWEQNKPQLQKVERDQDTMAALAAAVQMAVTRLGRVKIAVPA